VRPLGAEARASIRERLRARAEAAGLDGLLLLAAGNVTYATGFHFSVNERPVGLWLPVEGEPVLLVPLLERENAEAVAGVGVATYEEFPGPVPAELWMIGESGARRLAVDSLDARLLDAARGRVERLDLVDHAAPERAVKTPEEIALVREAVRFADLCLARLLAEGADIVAQGGTEQELLADCTGHARAALAAAHGATFQGTKMGITATVHSGPRAALPHGATLPRRPRPGETLIAGIGASLGGYHAESGATFTLGAASPEQARIMAAMEAATEATRTALAGGAACAAVNEAAMAPLRAAGLRAAIRHRIGHGMGVEGHEAPWLAPGDATPAAPGMVFSCEPGVYRPGLDGYRTIETLIVGAGGVETASRFQSEHPVAARVIPC
jgi:Xaa-Pro dipeptidase